MQCHTLIEISLNNFSINVAKHAFLNITLLLLKGLFLSLDLKKDFLRIPLLKYCEEEEKTSQNILLHEANFITRLHKLAG